VIYPCSGNVLSLKEFNVSGSHGHDFSPVEKKKSQWPGWYADYAGFKAMCPVLSWLLAELVN
jgi:hypothetical protein